MTEWHDIAWYSGNFSRFEFAIRGNVHIPEDEDGSPASENQKFAVRSFYSIEPPNLTDHQAHVLLAIREFARGVTKIVLKEYSESLQRIVASASAMFISHDDTMATFCLNWSEAAFKRGSASPRVAGAAIFPEVEAFTQYIIGMAEMDGWAKEELKRLS